MKTITKYIDEVSGREFTDKKQALKSEAKHKTIKSMFSWVKDAKEHTEKKEEKKDSCKFANGGWCVQRDKVFYHRLICTIIEAINLHEPWIAEQYEQRGGTGLKPENAMGCTLLGRYLSDGGSEIYSWFSLQARICPKCYREYGQAFYALHCGCDGTSDGRPIETRSIEE